MNRMQVCMVDCDLWVKIAQFIQTMHILHVFDSVASSIAICFKEITLRGIPGTCPVLGKRLAGAMITLSHLRHIANIC